MNRFMGFYLVVCLMFVCSCRRNDDIYPSDQKYDSLWSMNVLAATMIPAGDISSLEVYHEKSFDGRRVPDRHYGELKEFRLGLKTYDQNVIWSFLQAIRSEENRPGKARPESITSTWHLVFKSKDGERIGYGQYIVVADGKNIYGFVRPVDDGGFYYNTGLIAWLKRYVE